MLTPALFLVGCDGSGLLGTIETVEELRAESESGDPQDVEFEIFFETPNQMCPFGEDDNLPRAQGVMTARIEQTASVELPEGEVACGLEFDFQGIDPSTEQMMQYDDNFVLNFNGMVLASNNAQISDEFGGDELSIRALQLESYDFQFVTTGDNDVSDCAHEDFGFIVTAPVVPP